MSTISRTQPSSSAVRTVHRVEVWVREGRQDPRGDAVQNDAPSIGLSPTRVRAAKVFLIEAAVGAGAIGRLATRLLADAVLEDPEVGVRPASKGARTVEVHPLPGVMDPAAQTVREAARDLLGVDDLLVQTGWRYDIEGLDEAQVETLAKRLLANTAIQAVHFEPFHPEALPHGETREQTVTHVPIRDLDDAALTRLSREGHLFLSLDEMRAVQAEYQRLGREPTDIELETLAQTWSEHCVHKTLKSTIRYRGATTGDAIDWRGRPGHTLLDDGSVVIHNLLKSTVAAATHELIAGGVDWTLSVFVDNAGVVEFDDEHAVCIKVETHNHPSAIEPYGGAATGVGGCIRDVIGTGLAAKPIANTDVFCVAFPEHFSADGSDGKRALPAGVLHPRRVLKQVVAGVRDYGNRMGIPTVNGAVAFDDRYLGNPLVYCGCVGLLPRDLVRGEAKLGDRIIALGGRTGRDGIHGATFSSAELTDTRADEFSHAVQIGNAIEEKRVLDAILRARDEGPGGRPLFHAITDCGAGGFSSAIGEMGEKLGAAVQLERAPLKYAGLSYTEIWVSEAQERMVLAVPAKNIAALQRICEDEQVELADLGEFGTQGRELVLRYGETEVGRLPMAFLHEGLPTPTREAEWKPASVRRDASKIQPEVGSNDALLRLLGHPNIASKRWIIRQYDHEVQGRTVVKPLVGMRGEGPSDAAVIRPVASSRKGLAIGSGLATAVGDPALGGDPYHMAIAAIDEAVRNVVCVGADPSRIAILDNFCWPSCGKPENLGSLVRAAEGCYDGAKAYRTPFVSGKDSLNNQFTTEDGETIEIPPTLLITAMGIVPDVARCVTSDMKRSGSALVLVGATDSALGGSHLRQIFGADVGDPRVPTPDLREGPEAAKVVAALIQKGLVLAAHDCSDGGLGVAAAEMLMGAAGGENPLGAELLVDAVAWRDGAEPSILAALYAETPGRYLLEIAEEDLKAARALLSRVPHSVVGQTNGSGLLTASAAAVALPVGEMMSRWLAPLDW